jgi:hypothetical protein
MKKIYLLLIAIMLVCLTLTGCKGDEPTHEHNYNYSVVTTDPTDKEAGYTTYRCECGESYVSTGAKATEGLTYTLNADNTYTITGLTDSYGKTIVIPSHYEGLPVVAIGDNAFRDLTIVKVVIPSTVTRIGHLALCASLNFEEIEVSENNQHFTAIDGVLYSKDTKTIVQYPIGRDDTSFEIPAHVEVIGNGAFCNATSLTSVTIPEGVTSIGTEAFKGCKAITELKLPESLTVIGDGTFEMCSNLTTVNVPDSVTAIGEAAFAYCEKITEINIPGGITTIEDSTFTHCSGLKIILLPETVTGIGDYAFEWCDGLLQVQLSPALTSIGDYAFSNCKKLSHITLPGGLTHLGEWAFSWCDNMMSVNIPSPIQRVSGYAFYMCRSLKEIEIPEGITEIGDMAFYECDDLATVSIPSTVSLIGDRAFSRCLALNTIKVSLESEHFISWGGALYTHNGRTLIQYAIGRDAESFTVSSYVDKILTCAFSGASNLVEIGFENTSGWCAGSKEFKSEDLANTVKAAYYLTSDYDYATWEQSYNNV